MIKPPNKPSYIGRTRSSCNLMISQLSGTHMEQPIHRSMSVPKSFRSSQVSTIQMLGNELITREALLAGNCYQETEIDNRNGKKQAFGFFSIPWNRCNYCLFNRNLICISQFPRFFSHPQFRNGTDIRIRYGLFISRAPCVGSEKAARIDLGRKGFCFLAILNLGFSSWCKRSGHFGGGFEMGFFSSLFGFCGFGVGISVGIVIGYYLFMYHQPIDVKVIFYFCFN